MDLRQYFRKVREVQATIGEPETYVISVETADGGKAGVVTEVTRELAARMIVEGCATLASNSERERFQEQQSTARAAARANELAQKLQVTVIADSGEPLRASLSSANAPAGGGGTGK